MEITNEIKAKVFATYVGCECEYKWDREDEILHGKITPSIFESLFNDDGVITYCIAKLKKLSEITDEDAIEVAKTAGLPSSYNSLDYIIEAGKSLVASYLNKQSNVHGVGWIKASQFLQSRGYDLPHYLLGGKTLHEAGLAIYSKDI